MAARDYVQPGIRARVYDKDIGIIAAFAAELHSPTPLFSLAAAFYQAALAQGHDNDTRRTRRQVGGPSSSVMILWSSGTRSVIVLQARLVALLAAARTDTATVSRSQVRS